MRSTTAMLFAGFAALSLGVGSAVAQDSASGKPPPTPYMQQGLGGVQNEPGLQQNLSPTARQMGPDAASGAEIGTAPAAGADGSGSGKK